MPALWAAVSSGCTAGIAASWTTPRSPAGRCSCGCGCGGCSATTPLRGAHVRRAARGADRAAGAAHARCCAECCARSRWRWPDAPAPGSPHRLGMPTSRDSLLRLLRALPDVPVTARPGVGDRRLRAAPRPRLRQRRGRHDQRPAGRPAAGRQMTTVAAWLQEHPGGRGDLPRPSRCLRRGRPAGAPQGGAGRRPLAPVAQPGRASRTRRARPPPLPARTPASRPTPSTPSTPTQRLTPPAACASATAENKPRTPWRRCGSCGS